MTNQATDFITAVLAECSESATPENIEQFAVNHGIDEIEAAAGGDVDAIATIRRNCGLPVTA